MHMDSLVYMVRKSLADGKRLLDMLKTLESLEWLVRSESMALVEPMDSLALARFRQREIGLDFREVQRLLQHRRLEYTHLLFDKIESRIRTIYKMFKSLVYLN